MTISGLDHINIVTGKLEETRAFYEAALGLTAGPRPDFPVAGYWLYGRSDLPLVHLVDAQGRAVLTEKNAFGHIAFAATDLVAARTRLDDAGIAYRPASAPDGSFLQLFFNDPNGLIVELQFEAGT